MQHNLGRRKYDLFVIIECNLLYHPKVTTVFMYDVKFVILTKAHIMRPYHFASKYFSLLRNFI
jgi:hypothetical protein